MKVQSNISYRSLPEIFHSQPDFSPVAQPRWQLFNSELYATFELGPYKRDNLLQAFSGNQSLNNVPPLAQAYAGHQFGHFTMLGDGRAMLLGEVADSEGKLYDLQLKGSGRTDYSRGGDGRATLYSMLREYLISEAMYGLGIPTSRSLALVNSGEDVRREQSRAGGILTRVSSSHLRVGTFEYARHFGETSDLKALLDYTVKRHYPSAMNSDEQALYFLKSVMNRQIDLIVHWMRVGFIHGVMNTDNTSIVGETFDYGPCAFMNAYDPKTVFSSIDHQARYAFGNQPAILRWNLAILAGTLLPLIDKDEKLAINKAQALINSFPDIFSEKMYAMMAAKLGIKSPKMQDRKLIDELLQLMYDEKLDYTDTFAKLAVMTACEDSFGDKFMSWFTRWRTRTDEESSREEVVELMKKVNPSIIPRNHWVEKALMEGEEGDMHFFNQLIEKLKRPYSYEKTPAEWPSIEVDVAEKYVTFCGT